MSEIRSNNLQCVEDVKTIVHLLISQYELASAKLSQYGISIGFERLNGLLKLDIKFYGNIPYFHNKIQVTIDNYNKMDFSVLPRDSNLYKENNKNILYIHHDLSVLNELINT